MTWNSILTPDKIPGALDAIRSEIAKLDNAAKSNYPQSILDKIQKAKADLVNQYGILKNKQGVVTPDETNAILTSLENAEKTMNYKSYIFGIPKSSLYVLGIVVIIGIIAYKNRNK